MNRADLKPFYAYLDSRIDERVSGFWTQIDSAYLASLTDKDKQVAKIRKTFTYTTQDKIQYVDEDVEVTFDSYFLPSPLNYDIVDSMSGLLFFLKERKPSTETQIERSDKCVFMPTGILEEAFLKGKTQQFGIRKELYKSLNDLSSVIDKVNSLVSGLSKSIMAIGNPALDPATATQLITELTQIQQDLQDSTKNLES